MKFYILVIGVSVSKPHTSELNGGFSLIYIYMWKSHVEIGGYSVVYFDCITAFKLPYR